jgi:hypothetical protein
MTAHPYFKQHQEYHGFLSQVFYTKRDDNLVTESVGLINVIQGINMWHYFSLALLCRLHGYTPKTHLSDERAGILFDSYNFILKAGEDTDHTTRLLMSYFIKVGGTRSLAMPSLYELTSEFLVYLE